MSIAARIARFTAWRWAVPVAIAAAVALLTAGAMLQRSRERAWARAIGIPEMDRLAADGAWRDAYSLGVRVRRLLPDDSAAVRAWRRVTIATTIGSTPSGADVYVRDASDTSERGWRYLGRTPLATLDLPRGRKAFRLTLDGHAVLDTIALPGPLAFGLRPRD